MPKYVYDASASEKSTRTANAAKAFTACLLLNSELNPGLFLIQASLLGALKCWLVCCLCQKVILKKFLQETVLQEKNLTYETNGPVFYQWKK